MTFAVIQMSGMCSVYFAYCSVGGTVEATDDIVVDVPNMYDYVVEFIGPLILDSLLSLDLVNDIFKRSSDHESKYHGAFQKWINVPDRLSSQKKEELLNKEPAEWGKVFPPADEVSGELRPYLR